MMSEGGGAYEMHVPVKEVDFNDIMKTLNWISENPGCHPDNIRSELMRIHKKLLTRNYRARYTK